ncbi:hypothetical protein D1O30_09080 [Methylocystis hirsuta]|uniref:Uncharacterized protein n=1 Tax=Methylocystis hirsuta TaxID=369798 RepID=A0A3M9XRJ6_9HYPH|nr:hypothetical protein D1O30_09080 [Methylocystis hirsuta]
MIREFFSRDIPQASASIGWTNLAPLLDPIFRHADLWVIFEKVFYLIRFLNCIDSHFISLNLFISSTKEMVSGILVKFYGESHSK